MPGHVRTESPRGGGPPAAIIDSAERIRESYLDYLSDESRYGEASADRLVLAHDETQVAAALADVVGRGSQVTVSGGRTGIVGGAVPRAGTLLSLAEMNRIVGLRRLPDDGFALRAEPGVTIADLRERLEAKELGVDTGALPDDARADLESFLRDGRKWFYPPDPTEDTAHIGGTVAANASGARSFRYGATRRHVVGLRVCLASGEVLALTRGRAAADAGRFTIETSSGYVGFSVPTYAMPSIKNAAGYYARPDMDLVDLFVGSEGTLGVITEVEVRLAPGPEGILSALAFFGSDADALSFVRQARGDPGRDARPAAVSPLALEFFDSRSLDFLRERKREHGPSSEIPELPSDAVAAVLFEQDYVEADLESVYEGWETVLVGHGSSMDRTWGGLEESELDKLRALRHGVAEEVNNVIARAKADHPEIHKVGTDAAVPGPRLEDIFAFYRATLDASGLRYVIFGHVGDSHLHLNVMPRDPAELGKAKEVALAVAEEAVGMGGTVSAEHGIGKLKHDFLRLMYGNEGLAEMAAVKRALDPAGVINRGVMFPESLLS
jgi:D-lactate dehydrogenase (cytochrome)